MMVFKTFQPSGSKEHT